VIIKNSRAGPEAAPQAARRPRRKPPGDRGGSRRPPPGPARITFHRHQGTTERLVGVWVV